MMPFGRVGPGITPRADPALFFSSRLHRLRLQIEAAAIAGHRLGERPLRLAGRAEELPGGGVVGVGLQDLPAELFRLAELTGLVAVAGAVEEGSGRRHGRSMAQRCGLLRHILQKKTTYLRPHPQPAAEVVNEQVATADASIPCLPDLPADRVGVENAWLGLVIGEEKGTFMNGTVMCPCALALAWRASPHFMSGPWRTANACIS